MEFRKREVDKNKNSQPAPPVEPPFVYVDDNGKEIRIPMEAFRTLPIEKKKELFKKQLKGNVKEAQKNGEYPAPPGYAVTVVVENCMMEDLAKIAEVQKTCPAKMKMHEDYRLPINTYIARYFVLNGDEKARIEEHWLSSVPSVKFTIEMENGLTEMHRRTVVDGPDGERLETTPMNAQQNMSNIPPGAQRFDASVDMGALAKPCATCGKNRYQAPPTPAGPVGANR